MLRDVNLVYRAIDSVVAKAVLTTPLFISQAQTKN